MPSQRRRIELTPEEQRDLIAAARTVAAAIADNSSPFDIVTPGHVFPLRARDGGVLERPGHTEAAVDIARLAGFKPAAVLCEAEKEPRECLRLSSELR